MLFYSFRPFGYLLIGLSFVLLQFFMQLSFGIMVPLLQHELALDAVDIGWLSASYYLTYVILQLPAGAIMGVFGTRVTLSLGALFSGLSAIFFGLSDCYLYAFIARVMMGIGASFAFIGVSQILLENFPKRHYPLMVGFVESVAMSSALVCNIYFAGWLKVYSWHGIFVCAGAFAILIALLAWLFLPGIVINIHQVFRRLFASCQAVLANLGLWINGLYCGLLFAIVASFSGLWAEPFLLSVQKAPLVMVAFESSMLFLGLAFGSPLAGYLYRNCFSHRVLMVFSGLFGLLLSSWLIWWTPSSVTLGSIIFFLLGFLLSGYVICYSLVADILPDSLRSTGLGFTNTLGVAIAPILQVFIGVLIKDSHAKHLGDISVLDYQHGLILLPIVAFIAILLAIRVPK